MIAQSYVHISYALFYAQKGRKVHAEGKHASCFVELLLVVEGFWAAYSLQC